MGGTKDSGTYIDNETIDQLKLLDDFGGFSLQDLLFRRLDVVFGILSEERDKFIFFVFNVLDLKS